MAACIFWWVFFYSLNNVDNIAHKGEAEVPIHSILDEGNNGGKKSRSKVKKSRPDLVAKIEVWIKADQAWEEYKEAFGILTMKMRRRPDSRMITRLWIHPIIRAYLNDITKARQELVKLHYRDWSMSVKSTSLSRHQRHLDLSINLYLTYPSEWSESFCDIRISDHSNTVSMEYFPSERKKSGIMKYIGATDALATIKPFLLGRY